MPGIGPRPQLRALTDLTISHPKTDVGAGCWCSYSGVVASLVFCSCYVGAVNTLVVALDRREAKTAERARKRFKSFEIAAKHRKPGEAATAFRRLRTVKCVQFLPECRAHECILMPMLNLISRPMGCLWSSAELGASNSALAVRLLHIVCLGSGRGTRKECEAVQKGQIPRESATRPRP